MDGILTYIDTIYIHDNSANENQPIKNMELLKLNTMVMVIIMELVRHTMTHVGMLKKMVIHGCYSLIKIHSSQKMH